MTHSLNGFMDSVRTGGAVVKSQSKCKENDCCVVLDLSAAFVHSKDLEKITALSILCVSVSFLLSKAHLL